MNKIIYLDAAASYLKSSAVINAQVDFLQNNYANAGRGICARAVAVDNMISGVRLRVADFIGAKPENIVFTSGTTDGMNRVVALVGPDKSKTVALSELDHHSACLPWVASGANVVMCPLDAQYNFDIENIPWADVLVLTAMSNVLGVPQKVQEIIHMAREKNPNVIVVVDAAQYVVHEKIDAEKWGADFIVFSGHKIGADTGVGILYIKNPGAFSPDKFGGGMVQTVDGFNWELANLPERFEAGTLPLTQIAGLAVAVDEIENNRPDLSLIKYMRDELLKLDKVRVLSSDGAAVLSFVVDGMHCLDVGVMLGARNVCVRVGQMCAAWIHKALGVPGSIRISVGAYNTIEEVKAVVDIIKDIVK